MGDFTDGIMNHHVILQKAEIKEIEEKLELAKMNIDFIPLPYKITIDQVIKNCKLTNDEFENEINFTRDQHSQLEKIHKDFQKKYFHPEHEIAEKGITKIYKDRSEESKTMER